MRVAVENLLVHALNHGCVVIDPDASAVRRENEIVLAWMNEDVVNGNVWQVLEIQRQPVFAAVVGSEESDLGSGVEQIRVLRILADNLHVSLGGQTARDVGPRV